MKRIRWGGWDIPVLYEDQDLIAISKPVGILSVPIHKSKAISVEFILNQANKSLENPVKAIHRIDRYTSGAMLFAKNKSSHQRMIRQFLAHTPKREYLCWVRGEVKKEEGELIHYFKQIKSQFKNIVVPKSDPDATKGRLTYKVKFRYKGATQLTVFLDTGLKNQIRAQFSAIGHPLIGERQYIDKPDLSLDRPALHAFNLEVEHPKTGKPVKVKAPLTKDLIQLDADLYKNSL